MANPSIRLICKQISVALNLKQSQACRKSLICSGMRPCSTFRGKSRPDGQLVCPTSGKPELTPSSPTALDPQTRILFTAPTILLVHRNHGRAPLKRELIFTQTGLIQAQSKSGYSSSSPSQHPLPAALLSPCQAPPFCMLAV